MASFSAAAARQAAMLRTSVPRITLLEADHPTFAEPLRWAINTEDITHNGVTYSKLGGQVVKPDASDDVPALTIRLSGVGGAIWRQVKAIRSPAITLTLKEVNADEPDTAIYSFAGFEAQQWKYDGSVLEVRFSYDHWAQDPACRIVMEPARFPWLSLM